jgi:multidrug efflux system membrane fusion protein
MAFRVGGYVESLGQIANGKARRAIDKGDFVTKGSVLARVRAADYAQRVATSQAQTNEARASARLANEDLERARRLFENGAITRAELDAKSARVDSAEAQVNAALARLNEAGLSLGDTLLRAPMDAVVLSRQMEIGTLVAPGQPVITLADTHNVKAVFGAPQALVEKLALGSPLRVVDGTESEAKAPEKFLDARVTRIAPAADANGRVFSVEAALPNPDGALRPGAVVSIHVPEAVANEALLIPLNAVVRSTRDARGFAVFVLDGTGDCSTARQREVRLGQVLGNAVTVTDGLARGQRVVTLGSSLLRDGDRAVVIP